MHMCIETIYKAVCNLPFFFTALLVESAGDYCTAAEGGGGGGTDKMAEKGKQIVA